jgi:hypothetical protein
VVNEANVAGEFDLLKEKGFTADDIKRRFRIHTGSGMMKPLKNIIGVY